MAGTIFINDTETVSMSGLAFSAIVVLARNVATERERAALQQAYAPVDAGLEALDLKDLSRGDFGVVLQVMQRHHDQCLSAGKRGHLEAEYHEGTMRLFLEVLKKLGREMIRRKGMLTELKDSPPEAGENDEL